MAEQTGPSVAAIQAQQAELANRHRAVADADRELKEVLASAHAEMRDSATRLDAIAAEIDRAVSDQVGSAVDTPLGAREFQRFLVAKQREIAAVVAQAQELAHAKSAVLQVLREKYAAAQQP
jgi:predicted component of type VI protein secretion system